MNCKHKKKVVFSLSSPYKKRNEKPKTNQQIRFLRKAFQRLSTTS
ncbi:hypothetical protein AWRI1631_152130 [Saccharomyces cerevisiae AWRI1631]|uniref:Uncharacterized protein n=1 Tax=Saccharomyces cerevisiae (strain AWRI1631) TaxID=545124 RepID=B5VRV1_YEAS6|nr:hypothetical protein AWRI1631_152130 [Saccharomyces cerevisiae AWRI1631]